MTTLRRVAPFVEGADVFKGIHLDPMKEDIDLFMAACLSSDVWIGGSDQFGQDASTSGDKQINGQYPPSKTNNTSNQLTDFSDDDGAVLVCEFIFNLRASNAAITLTPKLKYGSTVSNISNVATITGAAACSATNSDYSGANQEQSILATMPSGIKRWLAFVTVGGTPAAGYEFWASVRRNVYVILP